MKLKRILGLLIVIALTLSLTVGCNGEDPVPPDGGNQPDADDNIRDLGGLNIDVGVFWSPDTTEPTTGYGRAVLEYREYIQEKHNFTIQERETGSHGDHADTIAASTLADKPVALINKVDPNRVVSLIRNNMFFDVGSLSTDLTAPKWNSHVHAAMQFDGGIFGFVQGYNQFNAGVVFYNKDVLREAGFDPYLPYDLQAANEWTWDAMMEIAQAVTRDSRNTGIIDTFGFCTFSNRTVLSALFSNGARFIGKDETGRFYNAANGSNAFLQAFDHVRNFATLELLQPQPEGANWDWWRDGFREGNAAFLIYEEYGKDDFTNVPFNWGMVLYPRGPDMDTLMAIYYENINTIPNNKSMTAELADDILFAFDLFTNEPPGYEDDTEAWKYDLYERYRDSRAVDETVAMIRSGNHSQLRLDQFVPSFEPGRVAWEVWNFEATGAQLLEEASQEWNEHIASANRSIFGDD
ncbi:MAG: extracellular solute-binding protein [Oscillospiraceae bacterium]|jgi:ABC-type glycerol-3-phosphate transport system substrate-binding protein|nr:extracellular solute-binding protein [Oscillospiraceae bacterium]